jgi:hypothetical protein
MCALRLRSSDERTGSNQTPCKSITKERDVFPVDFRQLLKFDEIDPSFSEFALRQKGMRFAESFSDFDLRQTGIAARLDQASEEPLV